MGRGGRGTKTTRKRGLAQRPPGHIQQYGAQALQARAHAWYDRDAHWLSLGYSEADAATKRRIVNWCWVVFVALTAVMVAASRTFEARGDAPRFSSFRCLSSLGLAAAVCYALVTDAYRNPPSLEGSPSHACGRWLGPYAYFTKHALTIQCVHLCLSFAGEATLDAQLLVMTHAFACFAAVVGIALTVLFLKLNWFEPKWRKEVLEATNQRGVNFTEITLARARRRGGTFAPRDGRSSKRRLKWNGRERLSHPFFHPRSRTSSASPRRSSTASSLKGPGSIPSRPRPCSR